MSPALDDAMREMRAGIAAYHRGDLDEAANHFERAALGAPRDAAIATNLGHVRRAAGQLEEAGAAYRRALDIAPTTGQAWLGLADVLRRTGAFADAARAYEAALAHGEATSALYNGLGIALKEDGELALAEQAYLRAIELATREGASPRELAAIHVNLGNTVGDQGRWDDAVAAYKAALDADGASADASFNLFSVVYDVAPLIGVDALRRAVARRPSFEAARFQLGAILALEGDDAAAAPLLENAAPHLLSSLVFVRDHGGATGASMDRETAVPVFADGLRLLERALSQCSIDGLVLELGVRRGASARFIAERIDGRVVHGFDSFEGLPTAWGGLPKGAYSTRGELPVVPDNVVLHCGWFDDTLPSFAREHPHPIRLLNVDCDLYSSAQVGFAALGHLIAVGTVIVFDEYLANPGWEDEEHRALVEAAARLGFAYRYLAFSLFGRQAAIVVTEAKPSLGLRDNVGTPRS